jgi:hypothetical protein
MTESIPGRSLKMRRLFIVSLTLLLPLTLGVACASDAPPSATVQQPAEEEHPEGEAEGEEHPEGEAAEGEEHPEGEAAEGEEHPEGEAAEGEEHPEGEAAEGEEHPEGEAAEGEEHPEGEAAEGEEHPEEEGGPPNVAVERLTIDQLAEAITEWVTAEAAANGGYLVIEHPDTGESLELSLAEVHRERLSRVGEQTYFACADFAGRDGTVYDLDIFMRGPNRETLETTEVTLHKEEGEARYTWYEEDGVWKTRPAA